MKFKFGFDKLLNHYHLQEDLARRDYAESMAKLEGEKAKLNEMYAQTDEASNELYRVQQNKVGMPFAKLDQLNNFIGGQAIRIGRQREVVINYKQIVEQKQDLLIAAAKERKIIEKLKEKKLEEFKKLVKKHEAKINDELVVTRFKGGERR